MNRMYDNLARRAILDALASDWKSALEANLQILIEFPDDTDALNRGAMAYLQLGSLDNAEDFSRKVITLDPLNTIAQKCLNRCTALKQNGHHTPKEYNATDKLFLEIPGKTKIVSLVNLCESSLLALLDAGDSVNMIPRMHKVAIHTRSDMYIGRLPDDLASRIIFLVRSGNQYDACLKSVADNDVKLFIKEVVKAQTLSQVPSFPIHRHF